MPLAPGTRLGPYEMVSSLGSGGMGDVYKARDTRLERTVAIKVLAPSLAGDPQFRDRFEREARAISQLTHPHICTLYDIGHDPSAGIDYLVLEYLEGETLVARLARGALKTDEALRTAIEICEALDKAHRAGILHRDLKPGNVMLTRSGAKLLDFGLAKSAPSAIGHAGGLSAPVTVTTPLTAQGTILGTFQYMAPELIDGQPADARADIWAFGCLIYEMTTGRSAFAGRTAASLFGAIMKDEPPPISQLTAAVSPALDRLAQACLAKDPEDRMQTAHDVLLQLRWLSHPAQSTTAAAAVEGPAGRMRARERILAATAALFLFTTIAAGVLIFRRPTAVAPTTRFTVQAAPGTSLYLTIGVAPWPTISPDGRQLAFVASTGTSHGLWIRPLDELNARLRAGTDDAEVPFWSADGRAIGFFAAGKLKTIDLVTGAVQVLCDASSGFRAGTWNREGVILFSHDGSAIYRIPASGGSPATVTAVPAGVTHSRPSFLPDGRRFLFLARSASEDQTGIHIGSLDSSDVSRVSPVLSESRYAEPGYLLFLRDRTLVAQRFDARRGTLSGSPVAIAQDVASNAITGVGAFSVSETGALSYRTGSEAGTSQLTWFDREGRQTGTLGEAGPFLNPELSPDGSQVAVQKGPDIWLIERARGIATPLTADAASDIWPTWSPDGRRVAYASNRGVTSYDIYQKPASGGQEERLFSRPRADVPIGWTPDGGRLLVAGRDSLWRLFLVAPGSSDVSGDIMNGGNSTTVTQISPDGHWIAYVAEQPRPEVFVQQFPTAAGRWQVSTGGGSQPRWRADSREVYYLAPDQRLMAVPFDPAAGVPVLKSPIPLFTIRPFGGYSGTEGVRQQFSVARDGSFLVNQVSSQAAESPIVVVLNWTSAMQ